MITLSCFMKNLHQKHFCTSQLNLDNWTPQKEFDNVKAELAMLMHILLELDGSGSRKRWRLKTYKFIQRQVI